MMPLNEQTKHNSVPGQIPEQAPPPISHQVPVQAPARHEQARTEQAVRRPTPPPSATFPPMVEPAVSNGMAVAALVLGIASVVFCWWGIATFVMVVLAIVFGSIGISRANQGAPQKNLAIAGLCCGIVGFIAYLIIGIFTFGLFLLI
jgi:hypothetical protein